MFDRRIGGRGADGVIAAILFVVAMAIAAWYVPRFISAGGKPWFYQEEFGPAVLLACGHGYANPDPATAPRLAAFLNRDRDRFECADLSAVQELPLRSMQRAFRYLIASVGWTWRLRGEVAWSALTPLYALLYGIVAVLAFAIFRQGMGRIAATLCAAAIAVSTLNLNNLPHLRDYGKAPFVLALVLIALRLVLAPFSSRRTLMLAGAAGLLTGIGIGFRNDVLVAIPAFVGVFAVFLPIGWRERIGTRLAAIAIYGAGVAIAMYPMLSSYATGGGSSSQHLVLLGLTPAFSRDLGVDNSRLYEWGFEYRDELALAMIDNYADRRLGEHEFLKMYGPAYDRAGSQYLLETLTMFPADMLTRVYASAVAIMSLPRSTTTSALMAPAYAPDSVQRIYDTRTWILRTLTPIWPWAFVVMFAAAALVSVRLGLFAALFLLYVSGYPALQFQERHFFHLEFVAWFALGCAASLVVRPIAGWVGSIRGMRGGEGFRPAAGWWRALAAGAALWCVLAVLIVTPLWMLRGYQKKRVGDFLHALASATRVDVTTVRAATASGGLRLDTPALSQTLPPDAGVHAAYVVAEIGGERCDALQVNVTERYTASVRGYDFTHTVTVPAPLSNRPTMMFFPAYYRQLASPDPSQDTFAFAGLELPAPAAGCIARLTRMDDPSRIPLLLDAQLPPDWETVTPYATISGVEARDNPAEVYAFPPDLPRHVVQRSLSSVTRPFQPADIAKQSKTFRMLDREWRVDGIGGVGGRGPLLYLVEMKPRHLQRGSFVVAEGRIEKGGVTFGLVRDVEWATQTHVTQTGAFAVVIRVPEDGDYKFVMANNLRGMGSLVNRVVVSRAGLADPSSAGEGDASR